MSLQIIPFYEPESFTWTYLVADAAASVAAIIDPVWVYNPVTGEASRDFIDQVLDRANKEGWEIKWVLETHAHADHLSCGAQLRTETGARLAIGSGICSVQATFASVYNTPDADTRGKHFDRLLSEGDEIHLGDLTIWVMETPGHTDDSITYVVQDAAFIGDTLFAPGFGSARCDFPGGSASKLFDSIQRIYGLPGDTRLFLCHDYPPRGQNPANMFSVDDMRRDNIHVTRETSREAYIDMREGRDAELSLPKLILPAIQVNVLGGSAPEPEENGFSYLKIPFNTTIPDILSGKS